MSEADEVRAHGHVLWIYSMSIERAAVPLVHTTRAVLGNLMAAGRGRDGRSRTVTGLKGNADADAPSGVELTSDSPET